MPPISQSVQVRIKHVWHCRGSKDEIICDVLRPAKTFINHLCADTGHRLVDVLRVIANSDGWCELKDLGSRWALMLMIVSKQSVLDTGVKYPSLALSVIGVPWRCGRHAWLLHHSYRIWTPIVLFWSLFNQYLIHPVIGLKISLPRRSNELRKYVLEWILTHGHTNVGQLTKLTYNKYLWTPDTV